MEPQLSPQLQGWLRLGFIRRIQASLIEDMEAGRPAALPRIAPGPEALGYVGVLFLLGSLITWLGEVGSDWATSVMIAVLLVISAALIALGVIVRRIAELSGRRFTSFCFAAAVGFFTVAMQMLTSDQLQMDDPRTALTVAGVLGTALAVCLYIIHRTGGVLVSVYLVALITLVGREAMGIDQGMFGPSPDGVAAIGYWVLGFGSVFVALAYLNVLRPQSVGLILGSFAALLGPLAITAGSATTASLLGLAVSAIAFLIAHVKLMPELSRFAAVGAFVYGLRAIDEFLSEPLGSGWVALALGGVIVLLLAWGFSRVTAGSLPVGGDEGAGEDGGDDVPTDSGFVGSPEPPT